MANYSFPTSESEFIQSEDLGGISKENKKDLDFIHNWVNNVSVENEVLRGKKLREQKPIPTRNKHEYDVSKFNFFNTNCEGRRYQRRSPYESHKFKTNPSTPRSRSPYYARPTSASSALSPKTRTSKSRSNIPIKTKQKQKCSMRIAELAVPTKRQCIDTWRTKSYVLPEFMVDRLKQHVMDQRPIVKIPEALYCFQRKTPQISRKCCPIKSNFNEVPRKPLRQLDINDLCIIFGHKIARKLSTPLLLSLSCKLGTLARVVSYDITQLMKSCPNTSNVEKIQKQWIINDVSNKVTVWIADILEDLSYKLLEEDLRVAKEKRNAAVVTETTTKSIMYQGRNIKLTELEEEEGPVLDFIDDLINNVTKICEPTPPFIKSDSEPSSSSKFDILEEESMKQVTPTNSITLSPVHDTNELDAAQSFTEDMMADTEYFKNKLLNIINEIDKQSIDDIRDNLDKDNGMDIELPQIDEEDVEDDEHSGNIEFDSNQENLLLDYTDDIDTAENVGNEDNQGLKAEEEIEVEEMDKEEMDKEGNGEIIDDDDLEQEVDTINEAENYESNVSAAFETLTEEPIDKDDKINKFSYSVNPDDDSEFINHSPMGETGNSERGQVHRNNYNSKYNVMFTGSNEHLLNYVNESWPANLDERLTPKLSESISKSVTSLGNIFECDEKVFTPIDEEETNDTKQTDDKSQKLSIDNLENYALAEETDVANLTEDGTTEPYTGTVNSTQGSYNPSIADMNTCDEKTVANYDFNAKRVEEYFKISINVQDKGKPEKQQMQQDDRGKNAVGTESKGFVDRGEEGRTIRNYKTQSQIDNTWKVYPKTAPSWVMSWGQGRGEPSEDSIPIQIRPTKVRESDIRKWCKDLEKAFSNLEMWSDWISNTCREATILIKKRETKNDSLVRKSATDWFKLKRNVKKDAILWTKLFQRTEDNFKNSKKKYHNIKLKEIPSKPEVNKTTLLGIMNDFENLSVALHRMIVSAEYCAMCTCNKGKTRGGTFLNK